MFIVKDEYEVVNQPESANSAISKEKRLNCQAGW